MSVPSASAVSVSYTSAASHPTTSATVDPDHASAVAGRKNSHAGAIAGGIVGGLAALTLLTFFLLLRRRQRPAAAPTPVVDAEVPRPMSQHIMEPVSTRIQQRPTYNPENPTTFPAPMHTQPANPFQSPLGPPLGSNIIGAHPLSPRGYTGAPEV
jgi:hypothetical protein